MAATSNHKFVRHNYDYQFAKRHEEKSPPPKLQNFLSTREQKEHSSQTSKCGRCCKLCLGNCEFVTVFILCFIVFSVFLFLFINCQLLNNEYISALETQYNEVSQVKSTGINRTTDNGDVIMNTKYDL